MHKANKTSDEKIKVLNISKKNVNEQFPTKVEDTKENSLMKLLEFFQVWKLQGNSIEKMGWVGLWV